MSWVIFQDPEALARVPEAGFNFSIPSAGISKPAHEIGMEDLEYLAVSPKYEPGYEIPTPEPGTERVIGVRITPSGSPFPFGYALNLFDVSSKRLRIQRSRIQ